MGEIRADHVAVYIRWSTDDQASGTTLEVQRDRCAAFLQSQGWSFRQDLLFIDDGYSGGSLDRPAMTRLRALAGAGEVDCTVVFKIDRLSRSLVDAVHLVLREWKDRCHLKSATEPLDTATDLGRAIFGILATFADFERAMIRERTSGGKERRIRDGQQVHGKPAYGYRLDPNHRGRWLEHPEEAPILRRIFQLVCDGASINQTVQRLNADRIPTRFGREWSPATTAHMLRNTIYVGHISYGRTSLIRVDGADGRPAPDNFTGRSRNPKMRKVVNQEPKYEGPTTAVPQLIDRRTFDRVQQTLDTHQIQRRKDGSRAFGSPYLLVGISRCHCGSPLVHEGRGEQHGYYVCSRHRTVRCRESGYIPVRAANAIVEREFLRLFGLVDGRRARLDPILTAIAKDRASLEAAGEVVERDRRRLQGEDQRILRAARAGEIPFGDLADLRTSLRRDIEETEKRAAELKQQLAALETRGRAAEMTLDSLDAVAAWDTLPAWERRQVLRLVLADRMVVRKRDREISVEIQWVGD